MLLALLVIAALVVGFLAVGVVAQLEDEAPGGFENLDGRTPPSALGRRSGAVLRATGVVLGTLGGLYFLVIAPASTGAHAPFWVSVGLGAALLALSAVLVRGARRAR